MKLTYRLWGGRAKTYAEQISAFIDWRVVLIIELMKLQENLSYLNSALDYFSAQEETIPGWPRRRHSEVEAFFSQLYRLQAQDLQRRPARSGH